MKTLESNFNERGVMIRLRSPSDVVERVAKICDGDTDAWVAVRKFLNSEKSLKNELARAILREVTKAANDKSMYSHPRITFDVNDDAARVVANKLSD